MHDNETATQQNILRAGKDEFLARGFMAASLRRIVKEAGVTTGAFYGYYKSKEELFDALVSQAHRVMMDRFTEAQNEFAALPPEEQSEQMSDVSNNCMDWMVSYIYGNFEAFKLLLCCADGTRYENFIHELVQIETESTDRFVSVLQRSGHTVKKIDPRLEHILVSGMLSGFFEIVTHDMPQKHASEYIQELRAFYTAGWKEIMGL